MYWNIQCHSTLMTVLRSIMLSPHLTTEEKRFETLSPALCGMEAGCEASQTDSVAGTWSLWTSVASCPMDSWPVHARLWVCGQRGLWGWPPSSLEPSFMCMTNGGPDIRDWASPPTPTFTPCPHPDHGLCEGAGTVPGMVSHWLPPRGVGS